MYIGGKEGMGERVRGIMDTNKRKNEIDKGKRKVIE